VVGSPDCRHSLLPKSGFTAVGLVDRSIHQLSSRHTIQVRFTLNSAECKIENWQLLVGRISRLEKNGSDRPR